MRPIDVLLALVAVLLLSVTIRAVALLALRGFKDRLADDIRSLLESGNLTEGAEFHLRKGIDIAASNLFMPFILFVFPIIVIWEAFSFRFGRSRPRTLEDLQIEIDRTKADLYGNTTDDVEKKIDSIDIRVLLLSATASPIFALLCAISAPVWMALSTAIAGTTAIVRLGTDAAVRYSARVAAVGGVRLHHR
ncbi:MAG: hypothetical protein ACRC67_09525 [Inquilinus sp.]|uniref:hypothetical protein n=1 Tax=Inquilinus sp. TaxID=1932117 RepID=UPI003F2DC985